MFSLLIERRWSNRIKKSKRIDLPAIGSIFSVYGFFLSTSLGVELCTGSVNSCLGYTRRNELNGLVECGGRSHQIKKGPQRSLFPYPSLALEFVVCTHIEAVVMCALKIVTTPRSNSFPTKFHICTIINMIQTTQSIVSTPLGFFNITGVSIWE